MHCSQILSVILGFACLSQALPKSPARRHTAATHTVSDVERIALKNFVLSSFNAVTTTYPVKHEFNRSLSFNFADQNSNTSTTCSSTWVDSAISKNTTAHLGPSYLVCTETNGTAKPEFFDWYFASYTNFTHFTVELAHEWSDPQNYPPPYDYVEYFASANVTLNCTHSNDVEKCTLPTSTGPISAVITSISN